MGTRWRSLVGRITGNIRAKLIAGVLILVPLVITFLVLQFLFVNLDGLLQPLITVVVGYPMPGVGIVSMVILLYLAGVVATNVFGQRLLRGAEHVMDRMPVVPSPICPLPSLPQHQRVPLALRAHACVSPTVSSTTHPLHTPPLHTLSEAHALPHALQFS